MPRYVDFSQANHNYRSQDYEKVFTNWSRHAKAVEVSPGTVIETWAIYKSWDFRQAYIERYAKIYSLSDTEKAALYHTQREAERQTYEFHVAVQMTNYKWNDLDKDTSPWRISLVDGTGAEMHPAGSSSSSCPSSTRPSSSRTRPSSRRPTSSASAAPRPTPPVSPAHRPVGSRSRLSRRSRRTSSSGNRSSRLTAATGSSCP